MSKCVIVGNGEVKDYDFLKKASEGFDIIAVDGGLNHIDKIGRQPVLLIGDFDSVHKEVFLKYSDIKKLQFNSDKDETDTELALNYALEHYDEIVLLAMTGYRTDHMISNIFLLKTVEDKKNTVYILDEKSKIFYGKKDNSFDVKIGDLVSIIPITDTVLTTENLKYSLQGDTLFFGSPRGVSNVCESNKIRIQSHSGEFLIIFSND